MSDQQDFFKNYWRFVGFYGFKLTNMSCKHKCIALAGFITTPLFMILMAVVMSNHEDVKMRFMSVQVIVSFAVNAWKCFYFKRALSKIKSVIDNMGNMLEKACLPADLLTAHNQALFLLKIFMFVLFAPSIIRLIYTIIAHDPFLPIWIPPQWMNHERLIFTFYWMMQAISILYASGIEIATDGFLLYVLVNLVSISKALWRSFSSISSADGSTRKENFKNCVHLFCDFNR